jgi:hypothetical protein
VPLQTWQQALDEIDDDPAAVPMHVLRFGKQTDYQGLLGGTRDSERRIAYLTKYLTKSIVDAYGDDDETSARQRAHVDRLHAEVRWLPCTPRCANWLRFGIQPEDAEPGLVPGECEHKRLSGRTSGAVAVVCWCRGTGPARPSITIAPTAAPWSSSALGRCRHRGIRPLFGNCDDC